MATLPVARPRRQLSWHWAERPEYLPDRNVSVGVLVLNGAAYTFEEVIFEHDDGGAGRRVILTKNDFGAEPYYIDLDPATGDLHCTCADWCFRAERRGTPCKHVRALKGGAL